MRGGGNLSARGRDEAAVGNGGGAVFVDFQVLLFGGCFRDPFLGGGGEGEEK